MSKELSPEHKTLIEGLIEKHTTEEARTFKTKGDDLVATATKTDWKSAMEELVTILSQESNKILIDKIGRAYNVGMDAASNPLGFKRQEYLDLIRIELGGTPPKQ